MASRTDRLASVWADTKKGVQDGNLPDYLMLLVDDSKKLHEMEQEGDDKELFPGDIMDGPQLWHLLLNTSTQERQTLLQWLIEAAAAQTRCLVLHSNVDELVVSVLQTVREVQNGIDSMAYSQDTLELAHRIQTMIEKKEGSL